MARRLYRWMRFLNKVTAVKGGVDLAAFDG